MADIVLATLNAKYIHSAFGLRYLLANLGELRDRAVLIEFDISQRPLEIVERLLAESPRIIGLGVYIWNVSPATEVVAILKRLRPDITVILGGPEVSYETEQQEIARFADLVITGEADLAFADVCGRLLRGEEIGRRIIPAELPDVGRLELPYSLYNENDIAHRVIYVEASRGCPFHCEFCLSSLDVPLRQFALAPFLASLDELLKRGVRHFKFVDRTFNLNVTVSQAILEFFLGRYEPGLFLHFEMIPDRLPESLRGLIARFPAGSLQFEVGIQTFNEEVAGNISRRQDYTKLEENLRYLRQQTGVHVHADLIVGLPSETVESFAAGFDHLIGLGPQEIQVGILKRLRGTPIVRHDQSWEMVYSPVPPYEILRNKLIDFPAMQRVRRFARYWDLVGNSGNFAGSAPLLWGAAQSGGPFKAFLRFSDWLHARTGARHGIALNRLAELLFEYLTVESGHDTERVAATLWHDFQRTGRDELPPFLRPHLAEETLARATARPAGQKRQARHLGTDRPRQETKG